ncbi:MAG: 50S ribosomal protein L15 [Candidatus Hydrogenedentes bacterium]|jgi:large subunit ribosomal protein L15|nr:50S ribosomal protein L15 [Candidatus Hydrogenedentota bacterium]
MDLHTIKSAPGARKGKKRVGRGHGSGWGKTAGRGHKGQKSRSGYTEKAGFEGGQMPLGRRLPKRGFHHENRHPFSELNLDVLDAAFNDGDEVTLEKLLALGIIKSSKGGVKLLGRGEITKRLTLKVQAASAGARAKIEEAGGVVDIVAVS